MRLVCDGSPLPTQRTTKGKILILDGRPDTGAVYFFGSRLAHLFVPGRTGNDSYSVLLNTKHFDFTLPYRSDRAGARSVDITLNLAYILSMTLTLHRTHPSNNHTVSQAGLKHLLINADIGLKYLRFHQP